MKYLQYMSLTGQESRVGFRSKADADKKWQDVLKKHGGWMKIGREWLDEDIDPWEYGAILGAAQKMAKLLNVLTFNNL